MGMRRYVGVSFSPRKILLAVALPNKAQRDHGNFFSLAEKYSVLAQAVRRSAKHVLQFIGRMGGFNVPAGKPEVVDDRPETQEPIRRAGAESTVLLKMTVFSRSFIKRSLQSLDKPLRSVGCIIRLLLDCVSIFRRIGMEDHIVGPPFSSDQEA